MVFTVFGHHEFVTENTRRHHQPKGRIIMNDHDTNISTSSSHPAGKRRGIAIGLAGGLVAGTAAGLIFGIPGFTSAAPNAASVTPAAIVQQVEPGSNPAASAEIGARLREALQPLVDDETINAEQADAVAAHLAENRPERGEGRGGPGAPGGRGGHGAERGGPGTFGRGADVDSLSTLLGLDAAAIRDQIQSGATLAEIATAQGVDPQDVIDELVAGVSEHLAAGVEDGKLDQAEADQKLIDAEAKIADMVTNGRPERGGPAAEGQVD